ncbi:MAG: tetratricopeptide repeat protein [Candidatus Riflebacteria bacterium]|nr:tetratricopeptide repeat protein [Candidatus Riflebacteria bacterium]
MKNSIGKMLVCASFIALLLVIGLPTESQAVLHIDTSYSGKFRNTPGYTKILADLPFVYQEAFQKIERSLGIPPREQMYLVVMFSDHLTYKGFRLRGKRQSMRTANRTVVHYIHLDLDFLINGQATLFEEMTHEMTHAVMADIMGLREYDSMPMWIKEGTAVHAADQGQARIRALTRRGFDINAIGGEDENIEGNPISLEKYVENYLRIRFLLKTFGSSALHRFVKRLMKSGNIEQELEGSFNGLTEEVMSQYAQDFIKTTLLDNVRPVASAENLQRGVRFFDEGEYLSARLALTDALYGGLGDNEFQTAAYLLAECYIQERNPQGALSLLKQFKPDPRNVPVDRYEFLSAYSEYAMGLVTNAYFGFKKAFETSNNSAVKEGALYYIIRILIELGNRSEADRVMALLRQQFPESNYLILAGRVLSSR